MLSQRLVSPFSTCMLKFTQAYIVVEEKEKASHHEQFESKRKAHYHGSHLKEALARAYHHEEEDEKDNDEPE